MENVRVLIVDDEPGMRLGAQRVLKKIHTVIRDLDLEIAFQCELAETGREALDKLRAEKFDLLLLDYKLPDISGLEVLAQIKAVGIDIMTIMMTAYASLEVAVSATKNGAFDFLAKPFSPEELESVALKAASSLLAARHAKQLTEEKRRVRFEFISVLSHELKSPLSAVEGYLQLMKDHVAGEHISDYDAIVERSLIRLDGMRRLIFDLLDLTRIESGEKSRKLTEMDVIAALRASLENVAEAAEKRSITICVNAPKVLLFWADINEIQMICNNLISNAVKYNRDSGKVDVDAYLLDNTLTLRVSDTGIGIDKADQGCLFSAFGRIRNRDTEHVQGSGLGLSILKKLAALYHGDISVESETAVGSIFTTTLKNCPPSE
jgi:signal transduction histidine kinase